MSCENKLQFVLRQKILAIDTSDKTNFPTQYDSDDNLEIYFYWCPKDNVQVKVATICDWSGRQEKPQQKSCWKLLSTGTSGKWIWIKSISTIFGAIECVLFRCRPVSSWWGAIAARRSPSPWIWIGNESRKKWHPHVAVKREKFISSQRKLTGRVGCWWWDSLTFWHLRNSNFSQ